MMLLLLAAGTAACKQAAAGLSLLGQAWLAAGGEPAAAAVNYSSCSEQYQAESWSCLGSTSVMAE